MQLLYSAVATLSRECWKQHVALFPCSLKSLLFFLFPTQVQADSQEGHLANRTVDLRQVQIRPPTSALRGHPEPHAGSRPGGKTLRNTVCAFVSSCLLPPESSPRGRTTDSSPLKCAVRETTQSAVICTTFAAATINPHMVILSYFFAHSIGFIYISDLVNIFTHDLKVTPRVTLFVEKWVIMPLSSQIQIPFGRPRLSLLMSQCPWLMCFILPAFRWRNVKYSMHYLQSNSA